MKAMLAPKQPATLADLKRWRTDPNIALEQKVDGDRMIVEFHPGSYRILNRDGLAAGFPVPRTVHQALAAFATSTLTLDGELVGDEWVVFDIIGGYGNALAERAPWEDRRAVLEAIFGILAANDLLDGHVRLLPTARTPEEKERLVEKVVEARGEGFMAKDVHSPYVEGRSDRWRKIKLTSTIDCVVDVVSPDGRENYDVVVYDPLGIPVSVGTVAWNHKRTGGLLHKGDVVEVVYLYTDTNRRLVQPRILRVRTDKAQNDCTLDQLRPPTDKRVHAL